MVTHFSLSVKVAVPFSASIQSQINKVPLKRLLHLGLGVWAVLLTTYPCLSLIEQCLVSFAISPLLVHGEGSSPIKFCWDAILRHSAPFCIQRLLLHETPCSPWAASQDIMCLLVTGESLAVARCFHCLFKVRGELLRGSLVTQLARETSP